NDSGKGSRIAGGGNIAEVERDHVSIVLQKSAPYRSSNRRQIPQARLSRAPRRCAAHDKSRRCAQAGWDRQMSQQEGGRHGGSRYRTWCVLPDEIFAGAWRELIGLIN